MYTGWVPCKGTSRGGAGVLVDRKNAFVIVSIQVNSEKGENYFPLLFFFNQN